MLGKSLIKLSTPSSRKNYVVQGQLNTQFVENEDFVANIVKQRIFVNKELALRLSD